MYGLRIILAASEPPFRNLIKEKLLKTGCIVVGEAPDGRSLLQMFFNIQPDLVIVEASLPGRNALEVVKIMEEHRIAPIIIIGDYSNQEQIKEVLEQSIVSYILKPVEAVNLFPAIEVSVATFKKVIHLEEEIRDLKRTLENKKVVDKAKGLLITYKGMSEQQAYRYMQKVSMDKCLPIQNVAKQVIKVLEGKGIGKGSEMA